MALAQESECEKQLREKRYKEEAKRLQEMKNNMGKAIDVDLSDEALKHREELAQEGEEEKQL